MNTIHWDVLPNRKQLELVLMKHAGYPIRVCTKPYGKFTPGARSAIRKATEQMPESKSMQLSLEIIPEVRPPHELKIQQSSEVRNNGKPMHDELLTNQYLNTIVNTLALNHFSSRKIHEIITRLDGEYNFTYDQIDKYLYRYWNTRPEHGWTIHRQQEFKILLADSSGLRSQFAFELENGFGQFSHVDVYINLKIATDKQMLDYLKYETMKRYEDTLYSLDFDNPVLRQGKSEREILNYYRLKRLQLSAVKELSMAVSRLSKTSLDLKGIANVDSGDQVPFRVYGSKSKTYLKDARRFSSESG